MLNSNSLILLSSLLIFLSLPSLNRATIRILVGTCHASGFLTGMSGFCPSRMFAGCCQTGQFYPQYRCSPPITNTTNAKLDVWGFSLGRDYGTPAECDGNYYNNTELVAALPTGWYDGGSRCLKNIRINGNKKSVVVKVVDECDSVNGCTVDQNYTPPCCPDVIYASGGVWDALGIPNSEKLVPITWSDA